MPLYSLGIDNDRRYSDPYHSYSEEALLFLNSRKPVNDIHYVDASSSIGATNLSNSKSKRYCYDKIGRTTAFELEKSCRIELMALSSSRGMSDNNTTYLDVHH
ncbi:hypothetical protein SLA2020_039340 [Shorea laevis]